jgi:NAD(P)-dependent dehydrogenase (short-subunit alcohol dehydrogenase family)
VLALNSSQVIPAKPKGNLLRSDGSYLLVGGLGGLGRAIALWMVHNGARNLIFANRSGDTKQEAKDTIEVLRKEGAVVQVYACDVAEEDQLELLIRESSKGRSPIRGVIQSAMVLKVSSIPVPLQVWDTDYEQDNMLEKMTVDEFNAVTRPKVQGTSNLHSQLPRNLDFFIMLSSVSGIIGNASQAAYAGANTFLDSFSAFRNSLGLPATTIDLGVILGIGHVAESKELAKAMERQGFEGTQENELMALLKSAVCNPRHGGSQSHIVTGMGTWSTSALGNFSAPLFSHFRRLAQRVPGGDANTATSLKTALSKIDSLTEATQLVCSALVAKVSALCMVPEETISPTKPVTDYGIDSLVAVEMRNWVFLEMDCQIAILELMANQSIESLAGKIAGRSRLVKLKAE